MSAVTLPVPAPALLTAEQYMMLPDDGRYTELVRGRIVERPQTKPYHGFYCTTVGSILREYVLARDLGRVTSNDSGVKTDQDPDTVRGADMAYYSYAKVSEGPVAESLLARAGAGY